jgi:hypothetical protein
VAWKVTVRTQGKVKHQRFGELDPALDARGKELSDGAPNRPIDAKYKQFEPIQQVMARLELTGPERLMPSVRAGVDVRGDGSTEAYVGRVRRAEIEQRKGETAFEALRRTLAKTGQ